jgi:hypothetical protein
MQFTAVEISLARPIFLLIFLFARAWQQKRFEVPGQ